MGLSRSQVEALDPTALHTLADQVGAAHSGVVGQADAHERISRNLGESWRGTSADGAGGDIDDHVAKMRSNAEGVSQLKGALSNAGNEMGAAKSNVLNAVARAESNGFKVGEDWQIKDTSGKKGLMRQAAIRDVRDELRPAVSAINQADQAAGRATQAAFDMIKPVERSLGLDSGGALGIIGHPKQIPIGHPKQDPLDDAKKAQAEALAAQSYWEAHKNEGCWAKYGAVFPPEAKEECAAWIAEDDVRYADYVTKMNRYNFLLMGPRGLELATDPATRTVRPDEAITANNIERLAREGKLSQTNGQPVTFTRDPTGKVDWIDQNGKKWDAVGSALRSPYFDGQWANYQKIIRDHMLKADFVPVDISGLNSIQQQMVKQFVASLNSPKVLVLGGS